MALVGIDDNNRSYDTFLGLREHGECRIPGFLCMIASAFHIFRKLPSRYPLLFKILNHIIINMIKRKGVFAESAFTTVELLIVIAVMAVIIMIAMIFLPPIFN